MIEKLIKKIVKNFVVGKVNDLLKEYKDDVVAVRNVLSTWTSRTKKILDCLESLSDKIEDNELDEKELREQVDEIAVLIKEW